MKRFFAFVGLLLTASIVFGQVPKNFNYQAVIRDGDGNLLTNTSVNLKFTITDGTTDYYQETQTATTDAFGTVAVKIGEGVPESGTWNNINWSANGLGLKAELQDNSNWIDLGTSEFGSVPFAVKADTSTFSLSSPVAMAYITADNSANTASIVTGYGFSNVTVNLLSGKYLTLYLEKNYTSEPIIMITVKGLNDTKYYTAGNFMTALNSNKIFVNITDSSGNQIISDCFVTVYFP